MKIAHIASANDIITKDWGGRGRLIYTLAKKQQREGHQVTIIAAPCSQVDGCNIASFVKPVKLRNNWLLNWLLRRERESRHHYKSFKCSGSSYDIIHAHITEEGSAFSFLAKSPCLVTLHGTAPTRILPYVFTKLCSITCNAKFVAYCKSAYLSYKKIYGGDILGYVHGGIDTSMFPFVSRPSKSYDIELCFVGRVVPEKGIHVAIAVVDRLHEIGYDVHLNVVGGFYPDNLNYFMKIVRMINERSYVSMNVNANQLEVAEYLGSSDALLFPIQWEEPFGFVMIESMSCGTPVVAFSRGSVPEIVQDGVNGFLCNNMDDMVNAVLNISNVDRNKCRQIVEKDFSVDAMHRGYLRIYKKIIESDRR